VPALVLVSAKGSPGVTTAAAALAAVGATTRHTLLAELDPAGGSVQVLASGPAAWGLVDAAGRLRREATAGAVLDHATVLPPGVPSLLAPTAGHIAESVVASAGDRWLTSLRSAAPDAVVDAGRWEPSQRTASRIVGADLVALVCRPTVSGIESARLGIDRLRQVARVPVAVVVVGRRPYTPEEIAGHLEVPLGGMIAWDPRGAVRLWTGGASRRWMHTRLARSAAATLAVLGDLADRAQARAHAWPPAPDAAATPASRSARPGERVPAAPGAAPPAATLPVPSPPDPGGHR
jgi:Flp pilus assembly CpaE family ATPase